MRIPGADQFVIDEAKIRDYELARFVHEDAILGNRTSFGQKYVVTGTIHGPAGRDAQIVVVWIILDGEQFPRFVTAYPGARA